LAIAVELGDAVELAREDADLEEDVARLAMLKQVVEVIHHLLW